MSNHTDNDDDEDRDQDKIQPELEKPLTTLAFPPPLGGKGQRPHQGYQRWEKCRDHVEQHRSHVTATRCGWVTRLFRCSPKKWRPLLRRYPEISGRVPHS